MGNEWDVSQYGGSRYAPVEGVAFLPDDFAVILDGSRRGSIVRVLAVRTTGPEPEYDVDDVGTRLLLAQSNLASPVPDGIAECLAWIQKWYASQCDGDWEHTFGISVETLDNPGWIVRINLEGTELEDAAFEEIAQLEPKRAWLSCRVLEKTWQGSGGPHMLSEILAAFVRWAASAGVVEAPAEAGPVLGGQMDEDGERRRWFERYTQRVDEADAFRNVQGHPEPLCPCCRLPTLGERGGYEICEICGWEDDGQDDPRAEEVWGGPNGDYSLAEARRNFRANLTMYRRSDVERFDRENTEERLAEKRRAIEALSTPG